MHRKWNTKSPISLKVREKIINIFVSPTRVFLHIGDKLTNTVYRSLNESNCFLNSNRSLITAWLLLRKHTQQKGKDETEREGDSSAAAAV